MVFFEKEFRLVIWRRLSLVEEKGKDLICLGEEKKKLLISIGKEEEKKKTSSFEFLMFVLFF